MKRVRFNIILSTPTTVKMFFILNFKVSSITRIISAEGGGASLAVPYLKFAQDLSSYNINLMCPSKSRLKHGQVSN